MRHLIKLIALLPFVFLLTGCPATVEPLINIPDAEVLIRTVNIDPELLKDCDPNLADLKGNDLQDVIQAFADSKEIHDVCYKRLNGLILVWKKTFPNKEILNASPNSSK
jgi:hypothetical protein